MCARSWPAIWRQNLSRLPRAAAERIKPGCSLNGLNIAEISALTVAEAVDYFRRLELTPREAQIAKQVLKELWSDFNF